MPQCDYCEVSFDNEDAYLTHLGTKHSEELGRIDRRRVADHGSLEIDDETPPPLMGYVFIALVMLFSVAMVAYIIFVGP